MGWSAHFDNLEDCCMDERRQNYFNYLASDEWKQKADQRREIDNNTCFICERQGYHLPVHHKTYQNIFNEDVEHELITLCPSCHRAVHDALNMYYDSARQLRDDYNMEVAERIKDIDEKYISLRADMIAKATLIAVGDNKTNKINSLVSYFEDALRLQTNYIHRELEERKVIQGAAFRKAMQLVSKARKKKQ